jgi:hypothetical protein
MGREESNPPVVPPFIKGERKGDFLIHPENWFLKIL